MEETAPPAWQSIDEHRAASSNPSLCVPVKKYLFPSSAVGYSGVSYLKDIVIINSITPKVKEGRVIPRRQILGGKDYVGTDLGLRDPRGGGRGG